MIWTRIERKFANSLCMYHSSKSLENISLVVSSGVSILETIFQFDNTEPISGTYHYQELFK